MLRIQATTTSSKLAEAVRLANLVFANDEFYVRVAALPSFTNTTATPADVAELMRNSELRPTLSVKRRLNLFSSVNAHVEPDAPTVININKRKLDQGDANRWATTLVHESVHCVDFHNDLDFTHDGNTPGGNEGSAPYSIQRVAAEMLLRMNA